MLQEEEIITELNKGNRRAFTIIFDRLYPAVYAFTCRFVPPDQASDFTSEAFFKLWENRTRFEAIRPIRSYLMVIVRNASLNYLERKKYHKESEIHIACLSAYEEPAPTEGEEIKAAYFKMLHTALDKLPKQKRRVLELAFFEGLKNPAIAERLNIGEGTVRNLKMKALKVLRGMINRDDFLFAFLAGLTGLLQAGKIIFNFF